MKNKKVRDRFTIIGFILIFCCLSTGFAFGQQDLALDIIKMNNGVQIKGIVIEDIKKKYLVIRNEELGEVKVNYNDIRYFLAKQDTSKLFYVRKGHDYQSFALGVGIAYGGMGIRYQKRVGRKFGFGYAFGVGYNYFEKYSYKSDEDVLTQNIALSAGLKLFFYKWFYAHLNLMINIDNTNSIYKMSKDFQLSYGADYFFNKRFGINAGIGMSIYKKNILLNHGPLIFDLGLILKFGTKH